MGAIAIIEAIATLLWAYARICFVTWIIHLRRSGMRQHVPRVVELIGNLVPTMIALLLVVIAGAMIGLPSVVVIIAVLFPAGLAFGLHMSLNDIRGDTTMRTELGRIALALGIGAVAIYLRPVT